MILVLPLAFALLLATLYRHTGRWRESFVVASLVWATLIVLGTEALSLLKQLTAPSVFGFWVLVDVILACVYWRIDEPFPLQLRAKLLALPRLSRMITLGMMLLIGLVGLNALLAPPNSWDVLAWAMPRVVQWIQQRSVAHFATPYIIQLDSGPWAEFVILHLHLLSGSDQYANLVQWFSLIGSALGVSLIAGKLGGNLRVQIATAAIALTVPMGIAQASGSLNDYVVAFWVVCFAFYILLLRENINWLRAAYAGLSIGLALLTKVTGLVYMFPFMVWLLVFGWRLQRFQLWKPLVVMVVLALCLNLCHVARNVELFGGPFGPTRRYGQMNETFSPAAVASNVIRNLSIEIATPLSGINLEIERAVQRLHQILDIDVNDPRTTYLSPHPEWLYHVSSGSTDGRANNPVHLLLILLTIAMAVAYKSVRRSDAAVYTIVVTLGFLLFCVLLKWTTNNKRYLLTYCVLFAPAITACLAYIPIKRLVDFLAILLMIISLPWVMFNNNRPLLPPLSRDIHSGVTASTVFNTSREEMYLRLKPNLLEPYREIVDFVHSTGCTNVGLLEDAGVFEYPLWLMLEQSLNHNVQIRHINVINESRSKSDQRWQPCVVIYLGDLRYAHVVGRFIQGRQLRVVGQNNAFVLALRPPDVGPYQFGVYVPQQSGAGGA